MEAAVGADRRALADKAPGAEDDALAQRRAALDDAPGPDARTRRDCSVRRDDRLGVHARDHRGGRVEELRDVGKIGVRIAADDTGETGSIALGLRDYHRGCARRRQLETVFRLDEERKIAGLRAPQRRHAADLDRRVTHQLAAQPADDLGEPERALRHPIRAVAYFFAGALSSSARITLSVMSMRVLA
jgi:hypothetical protein